MMCQPSDITMVASTSPNPNCPTIKANARLRRSHRSWADQQSGNNASAKNNTYTNNNDSKAAKKRRSRRRPTTFPRKPLVEFNNDCDASAASTAPLSSDESFSCDGTVASMSSFAVHNTINNNASSFKSKQKKAFTGNNGTSPTSSTTPNKNTQRNSKKRSTKNKSSSRPTVVNIVVNDSNNSNPSPTTTLTPEEKSRYIALDAEMVGIGPSGSYSRLARIALIDYDGNTLYDTMVRVEEKVTDYRTFVSGITEADITSDQAVSFDVAQGTVRQLIHNKIVVGHGLKNDFKVLGLSHPWYDIRDTAKYEPFMKVPEPQDYNPNNAALLPKKLRILAKDKLGLDIQVEGCPHSPVEDALAALELYKRHRVKWEKAMMYKMERTREIVASAQ